MVVDIIDSMALAMREHGIDDGTIGDVIDTVDDYYINHYGED
jgi:hypothetical protein